MGEDLKICGDVWDYINECGGLVRHVMDYTLSYAPRPNKYLALAGALSIVSHLAGRRYVSDRNTRPNLYSVALARSGCGKEFPRAVNKAVANECGIGDTVVDAVSSGAGLEDAVLMRSRILCQYDEIDTMFRAMKNDKAGGTESLASTLLTLFGASNSMITRRLLARGIKGAADVPSKCYSPSFTIFGTAIPQQFFDAMTERTLTNGTISRMALFVDQGPRPQLNMTRYAPMPCQLVDYIRAFAGVSVSPNGDIVPPDMDGGALPCECVVQYEDAARDFLVISANDWDMSYNDAANDYERAIYARSAEKMDKLALVIAIARDFEHPIITAEDLQIARLIIRYSDSQMISLAGTYCAENDFHAIEQKIIRAIKNGKRTQRDILRSVHMTKTEFAEAIETMTAAGEIKRETENGKAVFALG